MLTHIMVQSGSCCLTLANQNCETIGLFDGYSYRISIASNAVAASFQSLRDSSPVP